MMFISYAQNFEDVMLWRALNHISKGFCVDVGAYHPLRDSVTKAFYDNGWHGINIEPIEKHYNSFLGSRSRDINLCLAMSNVSEEKQIFQVEDTGLSTLESEVAKKAEDRGFSVSENLIKTETLNNILLRFCKSPIHFLKIDVEGYEKKVLDGIDLHNWRPWIILVEAVTPGTLDVSHETWETLIINHDYQLAYFDGLNRYYVSKEHLELLQAFTSPPNVYDNFITLDHYLLLSLVEQLNLHIKNYEDWTGRTFDDSKETQNWIWPNLEDVKPIPKNIIELLNQVSDKFQRLHEQLVSEQHLQTFIYKELTDLKEQYNRQMTDSNETIRKLKTDLNNREDKINELMANLETVNQEIANLKTNLARRDEEIFQLRTLYANQKQETESLKHEILFYALSKSWHITRPLRKFTKLVKGIKNA